MYSVSILVYSESSEIIIIRGTKFIYTLSSSTNVKIFYIRFKFFSRVVQLRLHQLTHPVLLKMHSLLLFK